MISKSKIMTKEPCACVSNNSVENDNFSSCMFVPPTNEASRTNYQARYLISEPQVLEATSSNNVPTLSTFSSSYMHSPWLPISKGDIKKLAQTRFVNSSPKSYRLMPASVESSQSDRMSFVEKAFHKFLLPVSYFLEVAKLWALSNRSELECTFTLANSEETLKTTSSLPSVPEVDNRRPICHAKAMPSKTLNERHVSNDNSNPENELLLSVNRFLESCQLKDQSSTGLPKAANDVGSETRRYLSQIVSLMNKKFAIKLQNGLNKSPENSLVKNQSSPLRDDAVDKTTKPPRVNVFTMSSNERGESDNEQFVIIHIPTSQRKSKCTKQKCFNSSNNSDDEPIIKRMKPSEEGCIDSNTEESQITETFNDSISEGKFYKCFYCNKSFNEKSSCARHMLSHLASSIEG